MSDRFEEIAALEARIEALAEAAERCRKLALIAKAAIGLGTTLILATLIGALSVEPATMLAALAAVLGGTVAFGSNSTTWKQTEAAIRAAEAERNALIDRIDPRLVANGKAAN